MFAYAINLFFDNVLIAFVTALFNLKVTFQFANQFRSPQIRFRG